MFAINNLVKSSISKVMLVALISSFMFTLSSCKDEDSVVNPGPMTTESYRDFDAAMQKLWADHMQWTFATVDAYFNNQGALQAQLGRLLRNQENIGAAIVPYYGQAAGDQLTVLLKAHINGAVPVLQAAKDGNQAALEQAITDWRQNARDISDFLSSANPEFWEQSHMREHMDDHISQTIAYSVDLLKLDYTQAVIDYDVAFDNMMHFSKVLSEGIANQYPGKF